MREGEPTCPRSWPTSSPARRRRERLQRARTPPRWIGRPAWAGVSRPTVSEVSSFPLARHPPGAALCKAGRDEGLAGPPRRGGVMGGARGFARVTGRVRQPSSRRWRFPRRSSPSSLSSERLPGCLAQSTPRVKRGSHGARGATAEGDTCCPAPSTVAALPSLPCHLTF